MADPFTGYARWREAGPVQQSATPDGTPVWIVTRHVHVRAALADQRLSVDKHNSDRGYRGYTLPPALDANLLNMDPPDHTRLRRLVSKAFTARRVEALRPRVQHLTEALLDAIAPAGAADLVTEFAAPLPLTVIGELLGVPVADRDDFRSWTNALITPDPDRPSQARDAVVKMRDYLVALIAGKRAVPADDLLSAMIAARDGGDSLSEDELTSLAFLVLWAGYEVTVDLIGDAVLELLRHPDQLRLLRTNTDLAPAAVDEVLRYTSPNPFAIRRFPTQDIEIGGVRIPAGDTVLLCLGSAHRDPDRFVDPDRFDIQRGDNGHLGFGYGVHYCLGAPLARVEAETALVALARRLRDLALAVPDDQLRWRPSFRSRGLLGLPVTFAAGGSPQGRLRSGTP
jgi:cytochrome P450